MEDQSLNLKKSALLSMDMQTGIVAAYAGQQPDLIERAGAVIVQARQVGLPVIHVKVGFRPGLPEVSSRNALFGTIKNSPNHYKLFTGSSGEIHSAVAPVENEVVVTKSRVNSFAGTDLEQILRAGEIEALVMMGIATSGVILSTALHASDADYRLIIISDCCTDLDAELHTCLMEKMFPRRGTVVTAEKFLGMIGTQPS